MPTPHLKNLQISRLKASEHLDPFTEIGIFDQKKSFIAAQATTGRNASFFQSLAFNKDLGATRGIDAALKEHNLDALVLPAAGRTTVPAGVQIHSVVQMLTNEKILDF